ncbi:MAG: NADH-quinone oxidoreductase subunit I [Deltaproteobacteria bacterium]|nr:NADH-quinone oxidoreductase subunit I [Deltaproteobacteria bacterium]
MLIQRPPAYHRWLYPQGLFFGFYTTMKHFTLNLLRLRKMPTISYPEQKRIRSDCFKGKHILTKKLDGSIRCTACMLCQTACPAECIKITASEHDNPKVEKFPISFQIDLLRCVMCGYCEEACPVDAIRMGKEYEWADFAESNFIMDLDHLSNRPSLKGGVISKLPT